MIETPQAYTARMLSTVGDRDPWDVLASTPDRLRQLTTGCDPAMLAWSPDRAHWSVAQILAHLADAEIVGAWRFRSMLAHDGVAMQAYDQNQWATTFRYEQADPAVSIETFAANRRATLALLHRVDSAALEHAGLHAERGRESVMHLVRMHAGHDLNHLVQIEALLAQARDASGGTSPR
jgi:uncharacterized damage-inducible protein DinB